MLELIHLVLDKGGLPVGREQAARRAAEVADPSSDLARDLDARAGGAIDRLVQAAARGDIAEFGTLSQEMRLGLDRSAPARIRCTVLANRLRRRRRPRLASAHRAGIAVGVMGPDGAGKTTLLHAVAQGFPLPASYVYLGLWADGTWDRWLHRLPGGRLGQRVGRLLRGSLVARVQRARGRLVLIDRLAHDALLPGAVDDSLGGQITRALAARIGPKVDVVFVLDAPAALMYARKREHSPEVLDKWRRSYLELARRLPEAVVIDASCPADEVRAQAVHLLWCRIVRVESRRADSSATELGAA